MLQVCERSFRDCVYTALPILSFLVQSQHFWQQAVSVEVCYLLELQLLLSDPNSLPGLLRYIQNRTSRDRLHLLVHEGKRISEIDRPLSRFASRMTDTKWPQDCSA